ncbi:MAG TPA: 50S ribosomal protein L24 [Terriglobales bacterium]|nr:50S ribosomal protein L24 [Terriglobales bacterium]
MDIRKDDLVKVIAGRDKGKQGKVLRAFPRENRVLVERVMMVKRHTRPNPNRQIKGGIAEHEAPIAVANVMLVCPECGPVRVKRLDAAAGRQSRPRACKKCGRVLDK